MIVSMLVAAILLLALYVASHRLSGLQVIAAILVGAVGLLLVIFPQFASYAATLVGVGRGTDLLLYVAVVCGMFACANLYFRSKRQETQFVTVVRKLALLEADAPIRE